MLADLLLARAYLGTERIDLQSAAKRNCAWGTRLRRLRATVSSALRRCLHRR